MIRLLTAALACAALALLGGAGSVQAQPFTHGFVNAGAVGATGGFNDAIYHCAITVPADNVPFTIVGYYGRMNNRDASPSENIPVKMALYSADGATLLDTSEVLTIVSGALSNYPLNSVSHYQITSAGTYEIAMWGDQIAGENPGLKMDTSLDAILPAIDTTFVMVSQTYGNAWPTLTETFPQADYHLVAGIIGIKGDAGIVGRLQTEDTEIDKGLFGAGANNNYGGVATVITCEENTNDWQHPLLRCLNVDDNLGASKVVDSCKVWVYTNAVVAAGDFSVYQVFKPWNEGALSGSDPADAASGAGVATWNDWSNDEEEWGTEGCENADDGGSDNSGDATGADRKATAEGTTAVSSAGWTSFVISAALAQAWYDGTAVENGVLMKAASTKEFNFIPSENVTGNWPVWQFYTSSAVEEGGSRRRKVQMESQ